MLEINGNQIYCEILGEGTPIITIHGFEVDHKVMNGCLESILDGHSYKRIYFDLPGMGKSKASKQIYYAEEMYEIIKGIIEKTIGNEKYILIGESYGGYLMRKLIQEEPKKILGAMFICPVFIPDYNKRTLPRQKILYNEIVDEKITKSQLYQAFTVTAVYSNENILRHYDHDVYSGLKIKDTDFLETYHDSGYGYLEDVDDIKTPFDKPTLFVMGKQDGVVGYEDSFGIWKNFPRASFCILDESGHNVQFEKIEIFNVLTREWLGRIKRYK
jgi:pimeloyl-ACP methyl ester carboxylesterase